MSQQKNWARMLEVISSWVLPGTAALVAGLWGPGSSEVALAAPGAAELVPPTQPLTFERPDILRGGNIFARHSSQSSHGSHSSHYSSSGGGYPSGGTILTPPPPPPPPPQPTIRTPIPRPLSGGELPPAARVDAIVMAMRVQMELTERGFYHGVIDGRIGPETRQALRAFQASRTLPLTGAMDDATLSALGVR